MSQATYREIGTLTNPNHALEVNGMALFVNVEGGSGDTFVPLEVYSDYSGTTDTTLGRSRQLRFRVKALNGVMAPSGNSSIATCDMGINYMADYFFITRPTIEISRPHGDFTIDYLGNVGINTIDPQGYNFRVSGTGSVDDLTAGVATVGTATINTSLTSDTFFEANGDFLITPNSANDNVAISLGDSRYFSAPLLFWGQMAAQVAALLNGPSGIHATLSVGDTTTSLGANITYLRTINPADATAFSGTQPSPGWVETTNLLCLADAKFDTNIGLGVDPAGVDGLTILSDATTTRGVKHVYGLVQQFEQLDSLGGFHILPTALNVQNTMSYNIGSMTYPQRWVTAWTNSGFYIPDLSGSYDTFSILQPNTVDPQTYPTMNLVANRSSGIAYIAKSVIGIHEGSSQTNNARFSQIDNNTDTGYCLRQQSDGTTHMNVPTSRKGYLRVNDVTTMDWDSAGIEVTGTIIFNASTHGLTAVTGDYGTVQTTGAAGGYDGFSCKGATVFMSNGSIAGIYNDTNNEWMVKCNHNGDVCLYYNGNVKLCTTNTGVSITGNTTISGNTTVGGTLGVSGATSLSSTLSVTGATTMSSTLTVAGATQVNNTFRATGATTLTNTLAVTGATTLSSTLTAAGATQINNTLGVSGATTLSNTLGVSGATTLSNTLGVSGATTLSSTLTAAGATQINNTLTVSNATQINSTLGVTGIATFSNKINATGNINTDAAYRMDSVDVIDTSKTFVGTGGVNTSGVIKTTHAGTSKTASFTFFESNYGSLDKLSTISFSGGNHDHPVASNNADPAPAHNHDTSTVGVAFSGLTQFEHDGHLETDILARNYGIYSTSGIMSELGIYMASDRRLKKNVTSLPLRSMKNFSKLRPVQYEWQSTDVDKRGIRFGFIAQEVQDIYPELVRQTGERTYIFIQEKCKYQVRPDNTLSFRVQTKMDAPLCVGDELVLVAGAIESDETSCKIKRIIYNDDDTCEVFVKHEGVIFMEDDFIFLKARVIYSPLTVNYEEFAPILVNYTQKLEQRTQTLEKRVKMLEKLVYERLKQ